MKIDLIDLFTEYEKYLEKNVKVGGWISSYRSQGPIGFGSLSDGTLSLDLQLVFKDPTIKLNKGDSLCAYGKIIESPAKGQKFEMQVISFDHYPVSDPATYPISKQKLTLEHLRQYPHLKGKTKLVPALTRITHHATLGIHKFLTSQNFVHIKTPLITGSDCEGAGETFEIKQEDNHFFKKPVYLTVSGQLQVEAYALAMSKAYTFGPTFRADPSGTTRHLAEFWMIEPELTFITLSELMDFEEKFIKSVIEYILVECAIDLAYLEQYYKYFQKNEVVTDSQLNLTIFLHNIVTNPFIRITYTKAIEILQEEIKEKRIYLELDKTVDKKTKKHAYPIKMYPDWGIDLGSEHEKYLTDHYFKTPTFIYNYPSKIKAFYMEDNEIHELDRPTKQAVDLLVPGIGELAGGSMRMIDHDLLKSEMMKHNLLPELDWYLELRRSGCPPHGGFGMGFERFLRLVTGMSNIRDLVPFPRTYGHCVA